jgi:hypothetical protein
MSTTTLEAVMRGPPSLSESELAAPELESQAQAMVPSENKPRMAADSSAWLGLRASSSDSVIAGAYVSGLTKHTATT